MRSDLHDVYGSSEGWGRVRKLASGHPGHPGRTAAGTLDPVQHGLAGRAATARIDTCMLRRQQALAGIGIVDCGGGDTVGMGEGGILTPNRAVAQDLSK
jgi:hypothetical protein